MSETLTNGVIVPDKGSRDWYADLRSNWLKLDSLMAGGNITVNPAQTEGILVATITVGGKEYKLYQQDGDVSVKIDPSAENAECPLIASTSAEANTGSVVMAPGVTVNPSTGAVTATSFKGKLDGNASTATNATKAVQDGAGAVITDTYATKKELGSKADDANVVHKSGTETIVGAKTFSNVTCNGTSYLKMTNLESNTTTPTSAQYKHIKVVANDGSQVGAIQFCKRDDGSFDTTIYSSKDGSNDGSLRIASNSEIRPLNSKTKLGISTAKWSEVWADTFKGNLVAKQINNYDSSSILRIFGGTSASTGANLDLNGENESGLGGGFYIRARNSSGFKVLTGKVNGSLTWNNANILTDANQIMLAKNLSGTNVASGGIIDCGTGNGKLQGWYINDLGVLVLSGTLAVGKWKNVSVYPVENNYSGMFVKVG